MTASQLETQNINKLLDLVNSCALLSLKHVLHCNEDEVESKLLDLTEDLTYDHWICCIVVSFKELSITFSVHFSSKAARYFTSAGTGKPIDTLDPKTSHDFMREYCNMTAGAIKDKLLKCDFESQDVRAVMLPVQKPSFDIGSHEGKVSGWLSNWRLSFNQQASLICSGKIDSENAGKIKNIEKLDDPAIMIDDSGDVEFF